MEFTGERFIPGKGGAQIAYEHLLRYLYAREAVAGKRVLDLGSGEGYGAFLLAQAAREAVGLELNSDAVAHAASNYTSQNLTFIQGSVLAIPLVETAPFDVVTCFEVIEHVPEPERILIEAKRVLQPGGLIIISTPNKAIYSDKPGTTNPFHLHEFYFEEFRDLLRAHFKHVALYGQQLTFGAALRGLSPPLGSRIREYLVRVEPDGPMPYRDAQAVPQDSMYFVAVCSDRPIPEELILKSVSLDDEAAVLQAELEANRAAMLVRLGVMERELADLRNADAAWQAERHRLRATVQSLMAEHQRTGDAIRALEDERTAWARLAETYRQERDQQLTVIRETAARCDQLEARVAALESELGALASHAAAVESDRARLQESHQETSQALSDIRASLAWKVISRYRMLLDRILPLGTLRRRAYHRVLRALATTYRVGRSEGVPGAARLLSMRIRHARVTASGSVRAGLLRLGGRTIRIEGVQSPPPVGPHRATVDVIVCVHNALSDVQRCVDAVLMHTASPYRLVLVDDGSEMETRDFLVRFAERHNAVLLRNEAPSGYTRAATQALRQSLADFAVLLNSDTVVTPGWLDRLVACAESDPRIALVGPLSNTASWQSIPEIESNGDWASNPLPASATPDSVAATVARSSAGLYPWMPFLNGFCLLIRREARIQIGDFDEENFGDGYGEENDYCLRARKAGWTLALADDAFVYHAQSRSYSNEVRRRLSDRATSRLIRKHGQRIVDEGVAYCQSDRVLGGIRARSRVMFARHNVVADGRAHHAGRRVVFVLPVGSPGGGANVVFTEGRAMRAMGVDVTIFNLPERRLQFERSYPNLDFPVVYGRPEELIRVATGVDAVIATAWESVEWLVPLSSGRAVCGYYVQDFEPYFHTDAEQRRRACASYSLVRGIVQFAKTPWTSDEVFRQTGVRGTVVGVSADIDLFRPRPRSTPDWPHRPLRIGAMIRPESEYRAPRLTMEVLRRAQRRYGGRVDILLFGTEARNSGFLAQPRGFAWRLAGVLNQNQVAAFLNDLDAFVDFSAYQAMGLTALEAMACGAAVLAPQRGGATSYLRHGENGLLVDTSSAEACWQALRICVENAELRARVQRQALSDVCAFYPERAAFNILTALFARSEVPVA